MYIKRILNINMGPIERADIACPRDKHGRPKSIILVGENGAGKSTILSSIVDSFYEMAGKVYNNARKNRESSGYQYFKAIMPAEIRIDSGYMLSYIEFEDQDDNDAVFQYLFKCGNLQQEEFEKENNIKFSLQWNKENHFKSVSVKDEKIKGLFEKHVFCYFGPDRYEKPLWMGDKYYNDDNNKSLKGQHVGFSHHYNDTLYTPITVRNVTEETLEWILDIIVDSRSDVEFNSKEVLLKHSNIKDLQALGIARKNVEQIMSEILGCEVYFGLNYRTAHGSRFNIISKATNKVIIPTLDSLSTGQSALFNMFATIVRYADNENINKSIKLDDIEGIVVIDEIELHLHSKLQKEVLPKLINLFPKVQFIITTHSPIFLLGMRAQCGDETYTIYQMPTAEVATTEEVSEFQNAYEYMIKTQTYQAQISKEINKVKDTPLIVTEGATDWRHIKNAYEYLCRRHPNQYRKVNFLEYNPKEDKYANDNLPQLNMGDSNLVSMCEKISAIPQSRAVIFVADADNESVVKKLSGPNSSYKDWGNNVYSLVLPTPPHRQRASGICIEHYYTDNTLKSPIEIKGVSRRLYLGNEFDDNGISRDGSLLCCDRSSCGVDKMNIIDGQSKRKVCKINGNREVNLALTKMGFAKAICNRKIKIGESEYDAFCSLFDVMEEILKNESMEQPEGSE